jgi:hypothetical protein
LPLLAEIVTGRKATKFGQGVVAFMKSKNPWYIKVAGVAVFGGLCVYLWKQIFG